MSQLSTLLSEAQNIADETSQEEQNFLQVRNKRKRNRNFPKTNCETIRPVIITINPRPTQIHFARSMRSSFPQLKINYIRELPNNNDFFIQPEDQSLSDQENVWWTPQNYNLSVPALLLTIEALFQKPKLNPVL